MSNVWYIKSDIPTNKWSHFGPFSSRFGLNINVNIQERIEKERPTKVIVFGAIQSGSKSAIAWANKAIVHEFIKKNRN